jgi:hypothetical protein
VHYHKIAIGHYHARFVLQRSWSAFDEIEQAVAAGFNMSAMLDVIGRPIALTCHVITLVKQGVECLKDKCFIFRFNRFIHFVLQNHGYALSRKDTCTAYQKKSSQTTLQFDLKPHWDGDDVHRGLNSKGDRHNASSSLATAISDQCGGCSIVSLN